MAATRAHAEPHRLPDGSTDSPKQRSKLFGATDSPLPVDHARSVGESAKPGVIGEVPPEPDRVAAESKTLLKLPTTAEYRRNCQVLLPLLDELVPFVLYASV